MQSCETVALYFEKAKFNVSAVVSNNAVWVAVACLPRARRHNHGRGEGEMSSEVRLSRGEHEMFRFLQGRKPTSLLLGARLKFAQSPTLTMYRTYHGK